MLSATGKRIGAVSLALLLLGGAAVTALDRSASFRRPPSTDDSPASVLVPIVAYDRFSNNDEPGTRDIESFRNDLERLHAGGFRPVLLSEYVHRSFHIETGTRPVVITFDASDSSQFRLLPKGEIDPACAVGVWYDFVQDHPNFPLRATFFLNPDRIFGDPRKVEQKLALLQKWGSEFGCVPTGNSALGDLSNRAVERNLSRAVNQLSRLGVRVRTLALPYGQFPRDREILKMFDAVVLPGAEPAPPSRATRELQALPRIQGDDSAFGLTKWLDRLSREPSGETR